MNKRISSACLVAICAASLNGVVLAAVPHTFVAGQAALASQVNENFGDLDGRVTLLEGEVDLNFTNLNSRVLALDSSVISLNGRVTTLETGVATLDTEVDGNFTNLNGRVMTLETEVATLDTEVHGNFTDLDGRVSALEATTEPALDFLEYTMPFSALGAPKNVVVLRVIDGADTIYEVRTRFQNNTEQVSVNGSLETPPFIAGYAVVITGSADGTVKLVFETVETPDDASYAAWNIEVSGYDNNGTNKTVASDVERVESSCAGGTLSVCLRTHTLAGVYSKTTQRVLARQRLAQFIDPLTSRQFDDVVVQSQIDPSSFENVRIRARGIGEVFRRESLDLYGPDVHRPGALGGTSIQALTDSNGDGVKEGDGVPDGPPDGVADVFAQWNAVYYRIGGAEVGSLVGTPFAAGGALEGVFF